MEAYSGDVLDRKILDCADRWGFSGKGNNYNPILGPLLLRIFRNQVGSVEASDKELMSLLELCQKKDEGFSRDIKLFGVAFVALFVGFGIYIYRAEKALKTSEEVRLNVRTSQITCKNPLPNKTA